VLEDFLPVDKELFAKEGVRVVSAPSAIFEPVFIIDQIITANVAEEKVLTFCGKYEV